MRIRPIELASLLGHVGMPDELLEAISYVLLIKWPGYQRKAFVGYAKQCRERSTDADAAEVRQMVARWRDEQRVDRAA